MCPVSVVVDYQLELVTEYLTDRDMITTTHVSSHRRSYSQFKTDGCSEESRDDSRLQNAIMETTLVLCSILMLAGLVGAKAML